MKIKNKETVLNIIMYKFKLAPWLNYVYTYTHINKY